MWISRKEYKFLKKNAEKNINAECEILTAKEKQTQAVARAMMEYSKVLEERDNLRQRVNYLENQLEKYTYMGFWAQGSVYDIGDVCSKCGYDSNLSPCTLSFCPSCHIKMRITEK